MLVPAIERSPIMHCTERLDAKRIFRKSHRFTTRACSANAFLRRLFGAGGLRSRS
jgi:hypothetical protein